MSDVGFFRFNPVLFGMWFRGWGVGGGVKHQVAADALNFLARTEQPQDVPRTTNTPDLKPESEIL